MSKESRELELKLTLDPIDVPRINRQLRQLSEGRPPVTGDLVAIYYDTPDFALHKKGVSFRVRQLGRQYVQTVKVADDRSAGTFDRSEWEQPVTGPQPDLSLIKRCSELKAIFRRRVTRSLHPVFQTCIRRTTYRLSHAGSEVQASLDEGFVKAGRRSGPLCELELEWVRGDTGQLFTYAKLLDHVAPLRLCVKAKADRGYELVQRRAAALAIGPAVQVSRDATSEEAFRLIGRRTLSECIRNEGGVTRGDCEALHQMRIALRRLRAAIAMFSKMVGDRRVVRTKVGLSWVTAELGPARDLDVFVAEVVRPLRNRQAKQPGLLAICHDFELRRTQAYRDAVAAIGSPRYRNLMLETLEWIETGPWTRSRDRGARKRRSQSIKQHATHELERRYGRLRRRTKTLRELSPIERHKLRIRAKKLRYAVEFFGGLFPKRKSARRCGIILSALKRLQNSLGALNDIAARESLASHVALSLRHAPDVRASLEKVFSAGIIFGEQEARVAQLLESAEKAYAECLKIQPFWK